MRFGKIRISIPSLSSWSALLGQGLREIVHQHVSIFVPWIYQNSGENKDNHSGIIERVVYIGTTRKKCPRWTLVILESPHTTQAYSLWFETTPGVRITSNMEPRRMGLELVIMSAKPDRNSLFHVILDSKWLGPTSFPWKCSGQLRSDSYGYVKYPYLIVTPWA